MKSANFLPVSRIANHMFTGDLCYLEGPVVSLYRDWRQSWIYLWVDRLTPNRDRWVVFPISRKSLVGYLDRKLSLRLVLLDASTRWFLDVTKVDAASTGDVKKGHSFSRTIRALKDATGSEYPAEYLPTEDSYFDESLAPDIATAKAWHPTSFDIKIAGEWFFADLGKFPPLYSQLYAFMYCTTPQFVTNIGTQIGQYLRSPWRGGFSRVNLFEALKDHIPAIHDLKMTAMRYNSPGSITVEALSSINDRVMTTVRRYLECKVAIDDDVRRLDGFLAASHLKKSDVSQQTDQAIGLRDDNVRFLSETTARVTATLQIEKEMAVLAEHSPNKVVTAKVLLALLARVERLAEFQRENLVAINQIDLGEASGTTS